jgi:hypothetical protein
LSPGHPKAAGAEIVRAQLDRAVGIADGAGREPEDRIGSGVTAGVLHHVAFAGPASTAVAASGTVDAQVGQRVVAAREGIRVGAAGRRGAVGINAWIGEW